MPIFNIKGRQSQSHEMKWTMSVECQFIVFNEHQHNSAQSQNHRGRYHIRHWKNFLSFMKGRIISIAWALWCHVHVSVINILVNSELISKQGLHITFILLIQVYSYATSHVILSDNASNDHTKSTSRQKYWLVTFKSKAIIYGTCNNHCLYAGHTLGQNTLSSEMKTSKYLTTDKQCSVKLMSYLSPRWTLQYAINRGGTCSALDTDTTCRLIGGRVSDWVTRVLGANHLSDWRL